MKFFRVVDFDEYEDKETLEKLRKAYQIIDKTIPISKCGRSDELLILITPSDAEVVSDFETCCTKAALQLRSGAKGELAVLNEARQICDSILKIIFPKLTPIKTGLESDSIMNQNDLTGRVSSPYEIIVNQSNAVFDNTGIKPAFVIIGIVSYDILMQQNVTGDRVDKIKLTLNNGEECELALVPELYGTPDSISVTPPAGEYYKWLHERQNAAEAQADELPQSPGPEQNKAG